MLALLVDPMLTLLCDPRAAVISLPHRYQAPGLCHVSGRPCALPCTLSRISQFLNNCHIRSLTATVLGNTSAISVSRQGNSDLTSLSTHPDHSQGCVLPSQDFSSPAPVLLQASPLAIIKQCDPVRQGPSSAQLQGQSCQVPRSYAAERGSGMRTACSLAWLPLSCLTLSGCHITRELLSIHSLEGRQEVREETQAQDAQDYWGRDCEACSSLSIGVCPTLAWGT